MNIIYMAAICPSKAFETIEKDISVAAYKFNKLLAEGLAVDNECKVSVIVPPSISNRLDEKYKENVTENGVSYYFFQGVNNQKNYIKKIIDYASEQIEETITVCDALGVSSSIASILLKQKGIKNIGIVTDLPQFVGNYKTIKEKVYANITLFLMRRFEGYVLLTSQMKAVVNKKNKPQCIIEGVADKDIIANGFDTVCDKKKVCMYAGSLHKEYGIDLLVEAFVKLEDPVWKLYIYGKGNYEDTISLMCKKYDKVKYFGKQPLNEIVEMEKRAMLLINPRPTNEEYTKYSFPSKNIEYMASGTPLLTTNLPGMPDEYKDHVYIFNEETVDGFSEMLRSVFERKDEELAEKGRTAQEFILSTRNNVIQAKKIKKLFNDL